MAPDDANIREVHDSTSRGVLQIKKHELVYRCELVTPMYGGGVVPGEVDKGMPIRATAIRGQLRFWWRLIHRKNPRYSDDGKTDYRKLFQAEREIWGGLGEKENLMSSRVLLRLKYETKTIQIEEAAKFDLRDGRLRSTPTWKSWANNGYALFPAQGKVSGGIHKPGDEPKKLLKPGYTWEMHLDVSRLNEVQRQEVDAALRWWATFGGVGARTRRGVGAIAVDQQQADCSFQPVRSVLKSELEGSGCLMYYPETGVTSENAIKVWEDLGKLLKEYRQGENVGRNKGRENRPGRSRWPEPDAIRRLSRTHSSQHAPGHPAGNVMPRAALGLPIIFHFKDKGDPKDTTLKPLGKERMASPLVLRPYRAPEGWKPCLFVLPVDSLYDMKLELTGAVSKIFEVGEWWPLRKDEAKRRDLAEKVPPIIHANKKTNETLNGFIQYFREKMMKKGSGNG